MSAMSAPAFDPATIVFPDPPDPVDVPAELAGMASRAVGQIAMLIKYTQNSSMSDNGTISGASCRYAQGRVSNASTNIYWGMDGTPSGTWRALNKGTAASSNRALFLAVRIS